MMWRTDRATFLIRMAGMGGIAAATILGSCGDSVETSPDGYGLPTGAQGAGASGTTAATGSGGASTSVAAGGASGGFGGAGGSDGAGGFASGGATAAGGTGGIGGALASSSAASTGSGGAAACGTTMATFPLEAGVHVPECTPITYSTNPPTSGEHYPIWAAYKTYSIAIPRGFYVHNMEHGAVVILYNCPSGCDADLLDLAAWLDARKPDPFCSADNVKFRIVVTPDPLIDVKFAATAWGASLKSDCFDLSALGTFIDTYYDHAPEQLCTDGQDLSQPGAIPPGCGQ